MATEGRSLVPVFRGQALPKDRAYFFDHASTRAVIRGDYKAVQEYKGKWHLFDLSKDKTETRNLAADKPELVQELSALWQGHKNR